jgi:hypothetical protein
VDCAGQLVTGWRFVHDWMVVTGHTGPIRNDALD